MYIYVYIYIYASYIHRRVNRTKWWFLGSREVLLHLPQLVLDGGRGGPNPPKTDIF